MICSSHFHFVCLISFYMIKLITLPADGTIFILKYVGWWGCAGIVGWLTDTPQRCLSRNELVYTTSQFNSRIGTVPVPWCLRKIMCQLSVATFTKSSKYYLRTNLVLLYWISYQVFIILIDKILLKLRCPNKWIMYILVISFN